MGEVILHQSDHCKGCPGRYQRLVLAEGVISGLNPFDDTRVGTRSADPSLFHLLDETCLGVSADRLSPVLFRIQIGDGNLIADGDRRQDGFLGTCRIDSQEPGVIDDGSPRLVTCRIVVIFLDLEDDGASRCRLHLRCDGSLPDEVVETVLILTHLRSKLRGIDKIGGADRFVFSAGILRQRTEVPGSMFRGSEAFSDQILDRFHRFGGEDVVVGPHVGDVTLLEQCVRCPHRPGRRKSEAVTGFLLQSTGDEGDRRLPLVRLFFQGRDAEFRG